MRGVPAPSRRVSRVPRYSGSASVCFLFPLTGLSPSPAGLPRALLLLFRFPFMALLTPACRACRLGSFHFARRYSGNHCCFLFLRLLRCFSSPGSPRSTMGFLPFILRCMRAPHAGFPIQTPADHWICAPPRSFSQLVASFFGS